jgi:hypothetical protein
MNDIEEKFWCPPDGGVSKKIYKTFEEIENDYGLFIAQLCVGYNENKEPYPKELISMMYKIFRGEIQPIETREEWGKETEKLNHDAMGLGLFDNGIVASGTIWKALHTKGEIMLYMTLNAYIVRNAGMHDKYKLYQKYYVDRKLLVSVVPWSALQLKTGMSRDTIMKAIRNLERRGVIEIEELPLTNNTNYKNPTVYILGNVENGKEIRFIMRGYEAVLEKFRKLGSENPDD